MKSSLPLLALGIIIGFGCAKMTDQPVVADAPAQMASAATLQPGAMFGIMSFQMADGTDAQAFQQYLENEYFPKWNKAWEETGVGVRGFMLKTDRGPAEGLFGAMMYFPDQQTRDTYFPAEGTSDAFAELRTLAGVSEDLNTPALIEFEGIEEMVFAGDFLIVPHN